MDARAEALLEKLRAMSDDELRDFLARFNTATPEEIAALRSYEKEVAPSLETMAEAWSNFQEMVLSKCSEDTLVALRRIFYAGAQACFSCVVERARSTEGLAALAQLEIEIRDFFEVQMRESAEAAQQAP